MDASTERRAFAAIRDISHLFRPGHLQQLRAILDDPEASANDRFVALQLLRNANVSAGMVLPSCQDTGTAIVIGKKGQDVWTAGDDEAAISEGVPAAAGDERHAIGLPGMGNLHSHAFQRGMAGLAEVRGSGGDSFW